MMRILFFSAVDFGVSQNQFTRVSICDRRFVSDTAIAVIIVVGVPIEII